MMKISTQVVTKILFDIIENGGIANYMSYLFYRKRKQRKKETVWCTKPYSRFDKMCDFLLKRMKKVLKLELIERRNIKS